MPERRPVLTPTEARQGSPRRMNYRVLTISLALAIVAAGALYLWFYGVETPQPLSSPPTATSEPR